MLKPLSVHSLRFDRVGRLVGHSWGEDQECYRGRWLHRDWGGCDWVRHTSAACLLLGKDNGLTFVTWQVSVCEGIHFCEHQEGCAWVKFANVVQLVH